MSEEDATGGSTVRQIGSHHILDEVLGQGSMGTVWRGHDLNDGSPRAIKVLKPELTNDKGATRRFIQERDILMTVADDAVVRVTDMVVESSTFAIIMELVDGPDLAHVLESIPDHRLEPATAVRLGIEVCQALTAIHRVGIRHLDIKPANILIEDREEVRGARITDFGVSEMVASGNPHEIVGTPYYQAPEVAAGRTPLAASDLYSFGVTLYQLLAGRVPFQADSAGNILRDQPPDHIPGVDPRLWNTIMTCLAPDPAGR
ncbi:serine/threonine protein kinase, partial [Cutibacterium avidum TM16]